jgi:hypothetical protein
VSEHVILPEVSLRDLQLAVATVSFRVATLAELVERRLGPQNALTLGPDEYQFAREVRSIREDLMKLTGELLGDP